MLTIHHDERTVTYPAYDETYYDLDELSPTARQNAIDAWVRDNADVVFETYAEDMRHALSFILDQLPNHYSATDKGGNLFLSVFAAYEFDGFPGYVDHDGVCYTMDLADAWNKYADEIAQLAETLHDTDYDSADWDDAEENLAGALNDAFCDVAAAYNKMWDAEYDYVMDGGAFVDFYQFEYVFDEDGEAYDRATVAA